LFSGYVYLLLQSCIKGGFGYIPELFLPFGTLSVCII
jgi:hypothetical protein